MTHWMFFITPSSFTINSIAEKIKFFDLYSISNPICNSLTIYRRKDLMNEYSVSSGEREDYVQFEPFSLTELISSYEEKNTIKTSSNAFMIKWQNNFFLREIMQIFADNPNILVDNEHGLILPIKDFLNWWEENPMEQIG